MIATIDSYDEIDIYLSTQEIKQLETDRIRGILVNLTKGAQTSIVLNCETCKVKADQLQLVVQKVKLTELAQHGRADMKQESGRSARLHDISQLSEIQDVVYQHALSCSR